MFEEDEWERDECMRERERKRGNVCMREVGIWRYHAEDFEKVAVAKVSKVGTLDDTQLYDAYLYHAPVCDVLEEGSPIIFTIESTTQQTHSIVLTPLESHDNGALLPSRPGSICSETYTRIT